MEEETERKKREKQKKAQISHTHADHRFSRLDGISAVGHISGPIRESRIYRKETAGGTGAQCALTMLERSVHKGASDVTTGRPHLCARHSRRRAQSRARFARRVSYVKLIASLRHNTIMTLRNGARRSGLRRGDDTPCSKGGRGKERERERNANGEHIYIYIYICVCVRSTCTHTHGRVSARYSIAIRLRYDAYAREGVQYALRCIMRYMRAICTRAFAR